MEGKKIIESASYVFKLEHGDTYTVKKDRFGDFKENETIYYNTVQEYLLSGYSVAILDPNDVVVRLNFD